jgi:hypothetical protein
MNSSTMNDFDDLYIIKKYQVFSNGKWLIIKMIFNNLEKAGWDPLKIGVIGFFKANIVSYLILFLL